MQDKVEAARRDFAIRDACDADLEAITAIYADAVLTGTASYEIDPPDLAEMHRRFRTLRDGGFPYLVAVEEIDGRVMAYAYAGAFRPRPAYRFMVEDSVYVAPGQKGRGIGRAIMGELLKRCEAANYRQVIAVVGDGEVNTASVRLHEACGFTHCGRISGSGFKHGRWLDTILMQKTLNGGTETLPDD